MEDNKIDRLTTDAKTHINKYLFSRLIIIVTFLGIVNAGALYGIYNQVAESAAEKAAEKAILSTEEKLAGLTKQFDQLSSLTTSGLASALVSVGEAKAKTEAINQDILGLKSLDLVKVKKVTNLLNKSTKDIEALINSAEKYNKATENIVAYKKLIETNKNNISNSLEEFTQLKTKSDKISKWVLYSYSSANEHGIWKNSKGDNHEVHIKWQQDHIDKYKEINKDLKEMDNK